MTEKGAPYTRVNTVVGKTKVDTIKKTIIREAYTILPINITMERIRKECDEHGTIIGA